MFGVPVVYLPLKALDTFCFLSITSLHDLVVLTKREVRSFHCCWALFNEIKDQFSSSIRVFCTDNALEYVKNDASVFCSKNEIIHQTSRSHAFQRNEVPERNIDIFWMLLEPWWYIWGFRNIYGLILCLVLVIWLIGCFLRFLMENSILLSLS